MRDDGFRDYVLEQLTGVTHVHARAMFGGVGLYADRGDYQAAGMTAFKPYADKPTTMSYFQVPVNVLEDADALAVWARAAIGVAK